MSNVASWLIDRTGISRLEESTVELEKNLETWIEREPSLVQGGLEIVSRQLNLDGGRLDLLAIDPQGRWVVIEVKAGFLDTAVITQALYYVAQISEMEFSELESKVNVYLAKKASKLDDLLTERGIEKSQLANRETSALVVGTGRTPGLKRLIDMLSKQFKVPISAILFDVFEIARSQKLLTREQTDSDMPNEAGIVKRAGRWSIQAVIKKAQGYATDQEILGILEAVRRHGLYARPYANSIMVTPMQKRTRMLFTFWAKPNRDKSLKFFVGSDVFPIFYAVSEKQSLAYLGKPGWRTMTRSDLQRFIRGLDSLFEKINGQDSTTE